MEIERKQELRQRNKYALARWRYLMRDYAASGVAQPDLRNQEQQDLGVELEWRLRVIRNERKRQ